MTDIEELFLHYYRPLCLYALRFLDDIDKAEDIVQDCFVKLLESQNLSQRLLFTTVRNRCIDELRRLNLQPAIISLDTTTENFTTHSPSGERWDEASPNEEGWDEAFEAARLWTAIDALPDRCREVFLMSKRDGMTYREIAEELDISERTVEHQISKALRILRSKASDFFQMLATLLAV